MKLEGSTRKKRNIVNTVQRLVLKYMEMDRRTKRARLKEGERWSQNSSFNFKQGLLEPYEYDLVFPTPQGHEIQCNIS